MHLRFGLLLLFILPAAARAVPPDHAERMTRGLAAFQSEVKGLLTDHCLKCHGGEKVKGDFDLATREGLISGGAEGVAVVPFSAAESRFMKMIRHEEEPHMPDKKPKLSDEVIAKLAAWIDDGAPYDAPLVAGKQPPRDKSKVTEEDRKWWAFQPLTQPPVPPMLSGAENAVDAFLLAKAREKGLTLNPPADARTLLRRAHLVLTGLPPSVAEADEFLGKTAADGRSAASEALTTLTEKLLTSPHFGERWARHWLDVARFAESSGFEHDYDRPHAWHYRDFVIRALNADMPFDQFLQWQLAGDEYAPGNAEAMMATGFLGAGVFPTQITANEVERVRYDALDDMISTTGSAFLGLTVGCARCHDHKFDPLPIRDYYRMAAAFTTTVRSNIDLELDPARSAVAKAKHKEAQTKLIADLAAWETQELRPEFDKWLAAGAADLAASGWTLADGELKSKGGAKFKKQPDGSWLAHGPNAGADTYTFTTIARTGVVSALKLEALADPSMHGNGPGRAQNGNFALSRIRISAGPPGVKDGPQVTEVKLKPGEFTHQQNAGGLSVASSLDDQPQSGWAVDGQIGKDHAAVFVFDPPVATHGYPQLTVTLEFAVNTSHNIGRPRFSFAGETLPKLDEGAVPAEITALQPKLSKLTADERETLWKWWRARHAGVRERERKIAEHAAQEPKSTEPVMVCVEGYNPIVMHSQGPPFLQETHFLKRGDTNAKDGVAAPGYLQVLMRGADESRWQWTPPEGAKSTGRRRSMAAWLTDTEHGAGALVARVTVNRIWQHHFGRGIVATPNDFGQTGDKPTHPELLDWLAGELIRSGWKQKHIHRLILGSAAWKQSAATDPAKLAADPDNHLFLRATPRRLEAEAARDSILAVSGALDRTLHGKGTLDENSRRRSIYFTVKRSQLVNSMVVFDAPEPLTSQGSRPTTTVAPQALFLLNSPQSRSWAENLAKQVIAAPGWSARVNALCLRALGRPTNDFEQSKVPAFLEAQTSAHRAAGREDAELQALTDYCQAIFGLNEFLYVP